MPGAAKRPVIDPKSHNECVKSAEGELMQNDPLLKIKEVKKKYEKKWLAFEGVVGVGIGKTSDGSPGLIISVKENGDKFRGKIPSKIKGIAIEIRVTGEFKALHLS
ncbi:MAG TPA: hypothetical protein ENH09_05585 [Bacteroidetes bacterium]|nr:hypothetical protein [Bacteroidota bacterium]